MSSEENSDEREPPTQQLSPPTTQKGSQKKKKEVKMLKLRHGSLEVIGYTQEDPMTIKMKCTLRTGAEKIVGKH